MKLMTSSSSHKLMLSARWAARVWGFMLLLLTIAESFPDLHARANVPWQEYVSPFFLLGGAVLGWLIAWRWEAWGGLVMVCGWLLSMITARLYFNEWLPRNVFVLTAVIFATPGILFLLCWWLSRKE
jgi:hypothetical protein